MVYIFSFNNQLPRAFDAVNAIITVEPTVFSYRKGRPESLNRQSAINSCAENLKRLWEQSLETNSIKTVRAIKFQIKKPRMIKWNSWKDIRKEINREGTKLWRKENSTLFYCFKPSFNLADFEKHEDFELEKTFYEDQINQRVMFVAEEIDEEYKEPFFRYWSTSRCWKFLDIW